MSEEETRGETAGGRERGRREREIKKNRISCVGFPISISIYETTFPARAQQRNKNPSFSHKSKDGEKDYFG